MRNAGTLSALGLVVGLACQAESRPRCSQFDEAEHVFNELTAKVLDPSLQDPRFVRAAELFEAVPRGCERYELAASIARSIRDAQATREAAPPPPPVIPPEPPPPPPSLRAPWRPVVPNETRPTEARPIEARPAPPPDDRARKAKECAALVRRVRSECPRQCRARSTNPPKGACVDKCEDDLSNLLSSEGCPPVKRLPRRSKPPAEAAEAPRKSATTGADALVYCAYFLPNGWQRRSYCTNAPLAEAQKHCDDLIERQGIEGTCACTDDKSFIGDRCAR